MTKIQVIQRGDEYNIISPDGDITVTTVASLIHQEAKNSFGEDVEVEITDSAAPAPVVPPVEAIAGPVPEPSPTPTAPPIVETATNPPLT